MNVDCTEVVSRCIIFLEDIEIEHSMTTQYENRSDNDMNRFKKWLVDEILTVWKLSWWPQQEAAVMT